MLREYVNIYRDLSKNRIPPQAIKLKKEIQSVLDKFKKGKKEKSKES